MAGIDPDKPSGSKRARTSVAAVPTSQGGVVLDNMLAWLSNSGAEGLDPSGLSFGPSTTCGGSLGCFGLRPFEKGEVFFSIPQSKLFGLHQCADTALTRALRRAAASPHINDPKRVTSELLVWLHMIKERRDSGGQFHPYFISLDESSPSPLAWPEPLRKDALAGTALKTALADAAATLESHYAFLQRAKECLPLLNDDPVPPELQDPTIFTLDSLGWARGHYLSRRYPGKHALDQSVVPKDCPDGREKGLEDLGILVPVLDILNHDDKHEYLKLRVEGGKLLVVCERATEAGQELWSNYGELCNERLLYAYGFARADNEHDTITVSLRLSQGAHVVGNFRIGRGGQRGVPAELWRALAVIGADPDQDLEQEEAGETVVYAEELAALLQFAQGKLKALDECENDVQSVLVHFRATEHAALCDHIQAYRNGQRQVLQELILDLSKSIEASLGSYDDDEDEDEDEEDEDDDEEEEENDDDDDE